MTAGKSVSEMSSGELVAMCFPDHNRDRLAYLRQRGPVEPINKIKNGVSTPAACDDLYGSVEEALYAMGNCNESHPQWKPDRQNGTYVKHISRLPGMPDLTYDPAARTLEVHMMWRQNVPERRVPVPADGASEVSQLFYTLLMAAKEDKPTTNCGSDTLGLAPLGFERTHVNGVVKYAGCLRGCDVQLTAGYVNGDQSLRKVQVRIQPPK